MAQQTINVGAAPNDGTGTPLRTAFQYTNSNFTELYTAVGPSGNNIVVPGNATITGDLTVRTNKLKVDATGVAIGATSAAYLLDVRGTDTTNALIAGTTKGIRFVASASTSSIVGVDNTGAASYQPLSIGGSALDFSLSGSTAMTLNANGLGLGQTPISNAGIIQVGRTNNTGFSDIGTYGFSFAESFQWVIGPSTQSNNSGAGKMWRMRVDKPASSAIGSSFTLATYTGFDASVPGNYVPSSGWLDRLIIDNSGNVGIGVVPSAWQNTVNALQVGTQSSVWQYSSQTFITNNRYFDGANKFIGNGYSLTYNQNPSTGEHAWFNTTNNSSGAGAALSPIQAMTLDAVSSLHVNTTAYVGVASGFVNALNGYNIVQNNTGSASNRNWQIATNGSAAGAFDFTISSANNTFPNSAYRMQLTSAGAAYNTTGTWGTISDSRLKENISDARNYLSDLLKLRVVKYSLKEEASAVATKLGLIAQEVEQVFPSLVEQSDVAYDGGDGIRTVKTSILVPMLLKAIQELTARVQTLETR